MGIIQEFKEFAIKGNAIDLAVAFVIGAAFTKIVNSIVTDLIMPPIGWVIGGVNFKDLKIVLQPREAHFSEGKEVVDKAEVAILYGSFINTVIEFLIIAVSVFLVVKMMNKLLAKSGSLVPGFLKRGEKAP